MGSVWQRGCKGVGAGASLSTLHAFRTTWSEQLLCVGESGYD